MLCGMLYHQHFFYGSGVCEGFIYNFFQGYLLRATIQPVGGDDVGTARIVHTVGNGGSGKAREDDAMHRPYSRTSEECYGQVRNHGHIDTHAVAFRYSVAAQHIGKAANAVVQLAVSEADVGRVGVVWLPNYRYFIRLCGEVSVEGIFGDVELPTLEPTHVRCVKVPTVGVEGAGKRRAPRKLLCDIPPKTVRVGDTFAVSSAVLFGGRDLHRGKEVVRCEKRKTPAKIANDVHNFALKHINYSIYLQISCAFRSFAVFFLLTSSLVTPYYLFMKILIKNALLVNEGSTERADMYIQSGRIIGIDHAIHRTADLRIEADGLHLLPGIIDDQVHFREPGLTHKADIFTESRAAVMGGVTSFMEMPNTSPPATTQARLEEKYARAAQVSLANYSFFMGAANDNLEEVLRTDPRTVCGVKAFMGSSTGNMLVDDPHTLDRLFAECRMLIAVHCEDEPTVRANTAKALGEYGAHIPIEQHPVIRDVAACWRSSSLAVELAKRHGTRLHILHISTADELALFSNELPLAQKRITSEVCVHHLRFSADDYATLGAQIKCNPAIKGSEHRAALFPALLDNRLDIIATDHAPHTWAEKQADTYAATPSGVPLVQHSLNVMLEFVESGHITLERVVEKMCHAPAECFRVSERGFLREGFWADAALVDLEARYTVSKQNLLYKCGWSPFEGHTFRGQVRHTLVSGFPALYKGALQTGKMGERLLFEHR